MSVLASRISYVGDFGWELYLPSSRVRSSGIDAAGSRESHGAVPVGIGVYGTTGRIEKGYRAFGFELDSERTIVEAGMQPGPRSRRRTSSAGGIRQAPRGGPETVMCTLTVEDHTSKSGSKRYMPGWRADPHGRRGAPDRRARPPPLRNQGRLGPVTRQAPAHVLPPAGPGQRRELPRRVSYMKELSRSRWWR